MDLVDEEGGAGAAAQLAAGDAGSGRVTLPFTFCEECVGGSGNCKYEAITVYQCGHSICASCRGMLEQQTCPACRNVLDFGRVVDVLRRKKVYEDALSTQVSNVFGPWLPSRPLRELLSSIFRDVNLVDFSHTSDLHDLLNRRWKYAGGTELCTYDPYSAAAGAPPVCLRSVLKSMTSKMCGVAADLLNQYRVRTRSFVEVLIKLKSGATLPLRGVMPPKLQPLDSGSREAREANAVHNLKVLQAWGAQHKRGDSALDANTLALAALCRVLAQQPPQAQAPEGVEGFKTLDRLLTELHGELSTASVVNVSDLVNVGSLAREWKALESEMKKEERGSQSTGGSAGPVARVSVSGAPVPLSELQALGEQVFGAERGYAERSRVQQFVRTVGGLRFELPRGPSAALLDAKLAALQNMVKLQVTDRPMVLSSDTFVVSVLRYMCSGLQATSALPVTLFTPGGVEVNSPEGACAMLRRWEGGGESAVSAMSLRLDKSDIPIAVWEEVVGMFQELKTSDADAWMRAARQYNATESLAAPSPEQIIDNRNSWNVSHSGNAYSAILSYARSRLEEVTNASAMFDTQIPREEIDEIVQHLREHAAAPSVRAARKAIAQTVQWAEASEKTARPIMKINYRKLIGSVNALDALLSQWLILNDTQLVQLLLQIRDEGNTPERSAQVVKLVESIVKLSEQDISTAHVALNAVLFSQSATMDRDIKRALEGALREGVIPLSKSFANYVDELRLLFLESEDSSAGGATAETDGTEYEGSAAAAEHESVDEAAAERKVAEKAAAEREAAEKAAADRKAAEIAAVEREAAEKARAAREAAEKAAAVQVDIEEAAAAEREEAARKSLQHFERMRKARRAAIEATQRVSPRAAEPASRPMGMDDELALQMQREEDEEAERTRKLREEQVEEDARVALRFADEYAVEAKRVPDESATQAVAAEPPAGVRESGAAAASAASADATRKRTRAPGELEDRDEEVGRAEPPQRPRTQHTQWLNAAQVAAKLRITAEEVREAVRSGDVKGGKVIGAVVLVRQDSLPEDVYLTEVEVSESLGGAAFEELITDDGLQKIGLNLKSVGKWRFPQDAFLNLMDTM